MLFNTTILRALTPTLLVLGISGVASAKQTCEQDGSAHGAWVEPSAAPGVLQGTLYTASGEIRYALEAELTRYAMLMAAPSDPIQLEVGGMYGTLRDVRHFLVAPKFPLEFDVVGEWRRPLGGGQGTFDALVYLSSVHVAAPLIAVGTISGQFGVQNGIEPEHASMGSSASGGASSAPTSLSGLGIGVLDPSFSDFGGVASDDVTGTCGTGSSADEQQFPTQAPDATDPQQWSYGQNSGSGSSLADAFQAGQAVGADASAVPGIVDPSTHGGDQGGMSLADAFQAGQAAGADASAVPGIVDPSTHGGDQGGMSLADAFQAGQAVGADASAVPGIVDPSTHGGDQGGMSVVDAFQAGQAVGADASAVPGIVDPSTHGGDQGGMSLADVLQAGNGQLSQANEIGLLEPSMLPPAGSGSGFNGIQVPNHVEQDGMQQINEIDTGLFVAIWGMCF